MKKKGIYARKAQYFDRHCVASQALRCSRSFCHDSQPSDLQGKPLFGLRLQPTALVNGKFGESAWSRATGSWVAIT